MFRAQAFAVAIFIWTCVECASCTSLLPNSYVPEGFRIDDVRGFTYSYTPCAKNNSSCKPLIFFAYDSTDAFSKAALSDVQEFLHAKPDDTTTYVFASHAHHPVAAYQEMAVLPSRFQFAKNMYFSAVTATYIAPWITELLNAWRSEAKRVTASVPGNITLTTTRLDSYYAWLPWPAAEAAPLTHVPDLCQHAPTHALPLHSKWILTANSSRAQHGADCTYSTIIRNAQAAGAAGVVVYASPEQEVELMRPDDDSSYDLGIPACMIPAAAGQLLANALLAPTGKKATITFTTAQVPGFFFSIDAAGRLQEVGWAKIPTLRHLTWASQWLHFTARLDRHLQQPALDLPLFDGSRDLSSGRLVSTVQLPCSSQLEAWRKVELYLQLGCKGPFDSDCPAWDHVVQLFVCCSMPPTTTELSRTTTTTASAGKTAASHLLHGWGKAAKPADRRRGSVGVGKESCEPCETTPWMARQGGRRHWGEGVQPQEGSKIQEGVWTGARGALCGPEVARWMTPFRRRVGCWVTDISALRALLVPGQRCTFTLQVPPWAGPWVPTLALRYTHGRKAPETPPHASLQHALDDASTSQMADARHAPDPSARSDTAPVQQQQQQLTQPQEEEPKQYPEQALAQQRIDSRCQDAQDAQIRKVGRQLKAVQQGVGLESLGAGGSSSSSSSVAAAAHKGSSARAAAPECEEVHVVKLFQGGTFDAGYNARFQPVKLDTPQGLTKAVLASYITGHGSDENGCAEFCPTSHHITVNSQKHVLNFTVAGTEWGCTEQVPFGAVPNEHGTWFYGRGGWCDGQQVNPWVLDVTHALRAPGQGSNIISYRGLYRGQDPAPKAEPGYIMMQSQLFLHTRCPAAAQAT